MSRITSCWATLAASGACVWVCLRLHVEFDIAQGQRLLLTALSCLILIPPWWSLLAAHVFLFSVSCCSSARLGRPFKRSSTLVHDPIVVLQEGTKVQGYSWPKSERLLYL